MNTSQIRLVCQPFKKHYRTLEIMDQGERAKTSIEKTENLLRVFAPSKAEKEVFDKAMHYIADAKYFHDKGDYFSSFGASDYAYGLVEALIIMRKGK